MKKKQYLLPKYVMENSSFHLTKIKMVKKTILSTKIKFY